PALARRLVGLVAFAVADVDALARDLHLQAVEALFARLGAVGHVADHVLALQLVEDFFVDAWQVAGAVWREPGSAGEGCQVRRERVAREELATPSGEKAME